MGVRVPLLDLRVFCESSGCGWWKTVADSPQMGKTYRPTIQPLNKLKNESDTICFGLLTVVAGTSMFVTISDQLTQTSLCIPPTLKMLEQHKDRNISLIIDMCYASLRKYAC
jgi:hypothetical protein